MFRKNSIIRYIALKQLSATLQFDREKYANITFIYIWNKYYLHETSRELKWVESWNCQLIWQNPISNSNMYQQGNLEVTNPIFFINFAVIPNWKLGNVSNYILIRFTIEWVLSSERPITDSNDSNRTDSWIRSLR